MHIPEGSSDEAHMRLAEEVADLLHRTNRRLRHAGWHEGGGHEVTPAQWRALRTIAWCEDPLPMSGVAERLGIARRSATGVVDELEARGLVARADHPTDRRSVVVSLTAEGHELLAELGARRRRAVARQLRSLDPAELSQLGELLGRLVE